MNPKLKAFTWVERSYAAPGFYGPFDLSGDKREILRDAWVKVVDLLTERVPDGYPRHGPKKDDGRWPVVTPERKNSLYSTGLDWSKTVFMLPEAQKALADCRWAILDALEECYAYGRHLGGSSLLRLASGELSLTDFDETIRPTPRK